MPGIAPGHGDGLKTVEFIGSLLGFGPGEELPLCPGFAEKDVHGGEDSTRWHGLLPYKSNEGHRHKIPKAKYQKRPGPNTMRCLAGTARRSHAVVHREGLAAWHTGDRRTRR